jgi:hypothetical protein
VKGSFEGSWPAGDTNVTDPPAAIVGKFSVDLVNGGV